VESIQEQHMRMALKLARKGIGCDSARPLAGAVVAAGVRPVGYGSRGGVDSQPAALIALEQAGPLASGATLYTNVEPCLECDQPETYFSRLLELRPERLVIGHRSPSPGDAYGRILAGLESAGTTIQTGLCESECIETNEVYYKYRRTGLPFVTVKFAASLDGRIATSRGDSQWISSGRSLRFAHQLRSEHDAVLVGIRTVLADDPQLTVRLVSGRSPIRVVADSRLRIPRTARLLLDAKCHRTIIATTEGADLSRISELENLGAEVLVIPSVPRMAANDSAAALKPPANTSPEPIAINLASLLAALGDRQLASILVEGGSAIITSLLANRSVDRLIAAIAPKIIGKGIEAVGDLGIERLQDAITFSSTKTRRLGSDIIFDGRLNSVVNQP
jgi:diaminohydroxyphosphoribosylaminopyrimidine deaminase/5-amino-6-(5-phosphoribosylamino)uracil reductase